jgi:hypothetical protein
VQLQECTDIPPLFGSIFQVGVSYVSPGYELGVIDKDGKTFYIFNHLVFNVLVHKTDGRYTRAQSNAYMSNMTYRRLLSWPKGTPEAVVSGLKEQSVRHLLKKQDKDNGKDDDDDDDDDDDGGNSKVSAKAKADQARKDKLNKQKAARVSVNKHVKREMIPTQA